MQNILWGLQKSNKLTDSDMGKIIGKCASQYKKKLLGKVAFDQDEMFALAHYFNMSINDIFLDRERQNGDLTYENE